MIAFLLLILMSLISGLFLTYKFKLSLYFSERILYGFVIALAAFTQLIYIITRFSGGLKMPQNIASLAVVSLFGAYSAFSLYKMKDTVKKDFKEATAKLKTKSELFLPLTMIFWSVIFVILFMKNFFVAGDGIYSSTSTDLPVHLSFITSFVWGENFPHQTPLYAGEKLVYPILSDYLSAFFISMGMNTVYALNFMGIILSVALTGIMYFFSLEITKSRKVSALSVFLLYLAGSLGFWKYFEKDLPLNNYNIANTLRTSDLYTDLYDYNFQLYNFIIAYLLPQRSFLFGFPMALIILTLLWKTLNKKAKVAKIEETDLTEKVEVVDNTKNEMLLAGLTAGILPLFHYHSFMCVGIISGLWFLLFFQKNKEYIKNWLYFFVPLSILALPQVLMATGGLGKKTQTFKLHYGWMSNNGNYVWFWLKNTGFMFILIFEALFSKSTDKNLRKMYIPYLVLFLLANVISFSPCWIGDNAKVIFFWFIGSMPFIALSLRNLFRNNKVLAVTLLITLTLSGSLDITKFLFTNIRTFRIWSNDAINISKDIINQTDPKAVFMTAPVHYSPIYLTGRKVLSAEHMHVCTQGIDPAERETKVKEVFSSLSDARRFELLNEISPDYIMVGPPELHLMQDKTFFERNFKTFLKRGEETVYKFEKRIINTKG